MDDKFKEWDKQLAEVDRVIGKAPPPKPAPSPKAIGAGTQAPAAAQPQKGRGGALARPPAAAPAGRGVGISVRVAVTAALAAALAVWPFAHPCGLWLAAHLGAVGVVLASGAWATVSTWQRRMPKAHAVALLTVLTGLVLVAVEVLPRIGYAARSLEWTCR